MHIKRRLRKTIIETFKKFPVITVVGPRQSGKTTLAKESFPDLPYVNIEDIGVREKLDYDPKSFLEQYQDGAIFDEIQRYPRLLSYLQVHVDKQNKNGLFVITGSNQQALSNAVSQSLAGRTAIFTLLPLSIEEILAHNNINNDVNYYLYKGFFPKIYKDNVDPNLVYKNYIQTYVERDVREILNLKELSNFQRFIKLTAGRIGQLVNASNLANEVGVSVPTINNWISVLESSYIIFRLNPYFENFGKRITKTLKLYFTDVGLATYLLDINSIEQLERDPLKGQLFENMVVLDFYKYILNHNISSNMYFFRDQNQNEVDLLYKIGNELLPIEIKSSSTLHPRFIKGLEYFNNLTNKSNRGVLVYTGDEEIKLKDYHCINYQNIALIFKSLENLDT